MYKYIIIHIMSDLIAFFSKKKKLLLVQYPCTVTVLKYLIGTHIWNKTEKNSSLKIDSGKSRNKGETYN